MPRIVLPDLNLNNADKLLTIAALEEAGDIAGAAELLGITRDGVKRRILKHRIEWPRGYKPAAKDE